MDIYLYDENTFEYLGKGLATIDPETTKLMGKTIYAYPPNCTKEPVGDIPEGHTAYFDKENKKWEIVGEEINKELPPTIQENRTFKYIQKYHKMMQEAEKRYYTYINTPIEYKGHKYLPRYAETYNNLLGRTFPMYIWDADGKNGSEYTLDEFKALKLYLEDLFEKAYQTKKTAIKKYLNEIEKLERK